jgi:hypothetical protein
MIGLHRIPLANAVSEQLANLTTTISLKQPQWSASVRRGDYGEAVLKFAPSSNRLFRSSRADVSGACTAATIKEPMSITMNH